MSVLQISSQDLVYLRVIHNMSNATHFTGNLLKTLTLTLRANPLCLLAKYLTNYWFELM